MLYNDPVYGEAEINEPVILEIIESPYMQRLKWIDQSWYFEQFFPGCAFKRFEHSMGVYLLLKQYWAPLEEQIAGLIHDLSHGVFSHCLDYVFDEWSQKEQNHQDNIFEAFVRKTDIPEILERHGLSIEDILDEPQHPLQENNLPDICADRIDYCLRTLVHFDKLPAKDILEHLHIQGTTWYFDSFAYAKIFAETFKRINDTYFSGRESAIMFQTVADICRYAWKTWYLEKDDFYTTDDVVLNKIKAHLDTDEQLGLYRKRMNNDIKCNDSPTDFDGHIFCKNRVADPLFMDGETVKRVSDKDAERKIIIETKAPPKEYFLKFEK
ncbi:MAG: hypothetical protein ACD_80C00046G0009 [uncultured bacterium (gcode 4)]|uniref:HD/PDEase domain-containing protein n=1 Tax=uncultured bacterium (gcode 4) TaxID=1234023 RepID=K1XJW3_9BACT|nr:MAG: hypothetical protein ACD_80C00046G0009 [uncultured bacterium (gcode 4)]